MNTARRAQGKQHVGRPETFTPEILDKLRQAWLIGCTDREASFFAGVPYGTLTHYLERHPDFGERRDEWKTNPNIKTRTTIFADLSSPDTAKWYAEMKMRDEFSRRTEHTGPEGAPLLPELDRKKADAAADDLKKLIRKHGL